MQGQLYSFTAELRSWAIEISYHTGEVQKQIQFCVKSKVLYNIQYKGVLSGTDLALQKSVWNNKAQELYRFLQKQNAKKLKIFDFVQEDKKLRIANRRDRNVICIELDRYVDSVKDVQEGKQDTLSKSFRVSTEALRFSKTQKVSDCKQQQQKVIEVITCSGVSNFPKMYKPVIKQIIDESQQDDDIDYSQWLNSNSDQQAQKAILQTSTKQSPSSIITSINNQASRFEFVLSQQIEDSPNFDNIQYSNMFPIKNRMMEDLIEENKQLKEERKLLFEQIALLSKENNVLKSTIQRSGIKTGLGGVFEVRQYANDCQYPELRTPEVRVCNQQKMSISTNNSYKYEQKQEIYGGSHSASLSYCQNVTPMNDEWAQEFYNTKRPSKESSFYRFFNPAQRVFDMSYTFTSLQSFKQNFFPYDWSAIKKLNLDGNYLSSQGFNLLAGCHFSELRQISAGYNCISEVNNIQPLLQGVQSIDLRANPLNEASRFYLKKIGSIKGIKMILV